MSKNLIVKSLLKIRSCQLKYNGSILTSTVTRQLCSRSSSFLEQKDQHESKSNIEQIQSLSVRKKKTSNQLKTGPDLGDFIKKSVSSGVPQNFDVGLEDDSYLGAHMFHGNGRSGR